MAKQKINVRLLRRIQKHITEEPLRLLMSTIETNGIPGERIGYGDSWYGSKHEADQKYAPCGTAACILGWARILTNNHAVEVGGKLVAAGMWPDEFRDRFQKAKTATDRARIAVERIDHFIKTNGAE